MKQLKTRPKLKHIKLKEGFTIPRKAMLTMRKGKQRKNHSHPNNSEGHEMSTRQEVDGVHNLSQDVSAISVAKSYQLGKYLAQKKDRNAKQTATSTARGQSASLSHTPDGAGAFTSPIRKAPSSQQKNGGLRTREQSTKKLATRERPATKLNIRERKHPKGLGGHTPVKQVQQQAQERLKDRVKRQAIHKSMQTAKTTAKGIARLKEVAIHVAKAFVHMAIGVLGGIGGVVAMVLLIGGVVAILATPFGVFWSGENENAQTMPMAVATVNSAFSQKITQIQTDNPTDSVEIHRLPGGGNALAITNWTDIVAVFAVKTAGATAQASDVVVMDDAKVALLTEVFWDMNPVTYEVESIHHAGAGDDDLGWTETILHITITSKAHDEMGAVYGFAAEQDTALAELMKPEYAQMFAELVGTYGGELTLTPEQLAAMLERLPAELSAERRAVVEQSYALLGQVQYFWGGKSHAIGWDSRWGVPTKVTAAGSSTTGTIRPLGLDCSGFVDWVFNNAVDYIIGQGGGATAQRGQCTDISWTDAIPGDLVFYPSNSHIGVYVGLDDSGQPLIIHCASSQNNVVMTGVQGFTHIGRPHVFASIR